MLPKVQGRCFVKVLRTLACMLLSVSLLAACGAAPQASSAARQELPDFPQPSPQTNAALNGQPYELVLSCDLTVYGSGTADGFYQVAAHEDGTFHATYIDYATRQQVYLCSNANCPHNGESCTSWFPAGDQQIWPVACEDALFFVHNDGMDGAYLERAELDGSNRQRLCTLSAGETFEAGAAYRPGWLVMMISGVSNQGDNAAITRRLEAIDTATGVRTTLFDAASTVEEGKMAGAFFQGVTTGGFVVKTVEAGADLNDPTDAVWLIPFDGSAAHIIVPPQNGEKQGQPHGEGWYYLEAGPDEQQITLGCIDAATGDNRVLITDLKETIPVDRPDDLFIRTFVDDWVILNAMTSNTMLDNGDIELLYSCYAVNTRNSEMRELTLSNYYHATRVPIEIYAQTGDRLLVAATVEEEQNPGGMMAALGQKLALMTKEEYLNSTADFAWITLL